MWALFSSLLLLNVAAAGADAPKEAALSKLEAIVSSMANDQDPSTESAPTPTKVADSDVVILEEEEHRRQLSVCNCVSFVDGASSGDANLCIKSIRNQHGGGVCRPYHGGCMSDHSWCTMTNAPSPLALPEEVDEEDDSDATTYVNAFLQLAAPSTASASTLPSSQAWAAFFAAQSGVTNIHVQAQASWGASLVAGSSGAAASVHVTVHVRNNKRRRSTEATIREMSQLTVDGMVFDVLSVNIFPTTDYPLVCTPESEALKAETHALMQQLVELRQQELALMRDALTSGNERCSSTAMQALANHIGTDLK